MRILILGATGFIGRNMTERLAARAEHYVHAVYNSNPWYDANVEWSWADLRDPKLVKDLMRGMDVVIQCAATTSGSKDIVNNPALHVTDNAVMNAYIFREAVEAKVKHVIFFSCTVMYDGTIPDSPHMSAYELSQRLLPKKEDELISPNEKYFGVAWTKVYLEKMCEFYSRIGKTKFTAIRHSNIFGPHDKYDAERSHFFGATIAKVEQAKDSITVWGDGQEARDLLYISDLCDFVEAAIEKQTNKFELFNCGLGKAFPVYDVVNKIIEASKKNISIKYDYSKPTIRTSLCLDSSKAKKILNWEPKVCLDKGIALTLDWYRKYKI